MCSTDTITNSEVAQIRIDPIETRRAPRHRLKRGFVAFGSENFGEIVNISQTGIAIEFMAHKDAESIDFSEINLLNNLEGYLISQLGCSTVYTSDKPTSPNNDHTVLRRIGMRFTPMDENQKAQLSTLLENYSDGEYPMTN